MNSTFQQSFASRFSFGFCRQYFYQSTEFSSFRTLSIWQNVPDRDRRDLYDDLVVTLAKQEKENTRNMRKNNMRKLTKLLHDDLEGLSHKTMWKEAQELLYDCDEFSNDKDWVRQFSQRYLMPVLQNLLAYLYEFFKPCG